MSEPISDPDKAVARLLALAFVIFALGTGSKAMTVLSGTEALGWTFLTSMLLLLAYFGAIYRTRWWR